MKTKFCTNHYYNEMLKLIKNIFVTPGWENWWEGDHLLRSLIFKGENGHQNLWDKGNAAKHSSPGPNFGWGVLWEGCYLQRCNVSKERMGTRIWRALGNVVKHSPLPFPTQVGRGGVAVERGSFA